MQSSVSLSSYSPSKSPQLLKNQSSGAVFFETLISLGVLSLICFAAFELVVNLNKQLYLQDSMRRAAMSIQDLSIGSTGGSVCERAEVILRESMEESYDPLQDSGIELKICPVTLGSETSEPRIGSLNFSISIQDNSSWIRLRNKFSTVVAMNQAIFQKTSEINCPEMENVCS